jgi:phosphatidate cytidylyltransferase
VAVAERRRKRERRPIGGSGMRGRILVAIPAIAFAIFIIVQGGAVFAAGVAALGLVCLHELYGLYPQTHPARLAGFAGLLGLTAAALWGDVPTVLLVFVASLPLVFLVSVLQWPRGTPGGASLTILGLAWIGLAVAHAVLLRESPHGNGIVVDVLVGVFIGDSAAMTGGQMFGRHKLAPAISPNKTWEGLAIGFVVGVAAVWFAGLYQDWLSGVDALILGVAVCAAGPVGDLFESFFKRDAGVKDTGRFFGAHGGALDRLDAVLFAAVTGYWVWQALL